MIFALILAALCCLYLFLIAPGLSHRPLGPFAGLYAHRGLWDAEKGIPENSVPAFRQAVAAGFGIETDVHLTRDGQLVVFHDDTLQRMCGDDRAIADCTLSELKSLRLNGTDETIPTFDECLEAVDAKTPLLVEIKTCRDVGTLCARVNERLSSYQGPYLIESFDPRAVRWYKKNRPDILRGQLTFGLVRPSKLPKIPLTRLLASQVPNCLGRPDFLACEAVTDHSLPLKLTRLFRPHLAAWTVRSPEEMAGLKDRYEIQIFEGFTPPTH